VQQNHCHYDYNIAVKKSLQYIYIYIYIYLQIKNKKKLKNLVCLSLYVSRAYRNLASRVGYVSDIFFLFKNNDLTDTLLIRVSERIGIGCVSDTIRWHFLSIGASEQETIQVTLEER
jgi:sporulation protein YlmC with PRC-barrel domain